MNVAGKEYDRLVARERPEQRFECRWLVGPRFGIHSEKQPRETLERNERQFHPLRAEHRHAGYDERQLGVAGRRWRDRDSHRRIAEETGRALVVEAAT